MQRIFKRPVLTLRSGLHCSVFDASVPKSFLVAPEAIVDDCMSQPCLLEHKLAFLSYQLSLDVVFTQH